METIDAIVDVHWQRERIIESGVFSKNDTGNLIIQTKEANAEHIIKSCYISFVRTSNEKDNELCIAIRSILLRKFFPETEDTIFQNIIKNSEILIPVPIMLKGGDKIFIFKFVDGKPRGKTFQITEVLK